MNNNNFNKQPILFNNDNLINSAKNNNNNNFNNISKPAIIKPAYSNLNNNINLNVIPKKEISKYNSYYNNNNNDQLLFTNSGLNKTQLNNTYQNINNTNNNILPLNNSNYTGGNINYTGIIKPKVEYIDSYGSNNNPTNIILSPQPQPKMIIYNTIPCENYVEYNQFENPKIETIPTYNKTLTFQNNIEPCNYTYETKEISSV